MKITVTTGGEEFDSRLVEPTRTDGKNVRDAHMTVAVLILGKHLTVPTGIPLIAIYDGDHYHFGHPETGEALMFPSQLIYRWSRLVTKAGGLPVDDFDPSTHEFSHGPSS